MGEQNDDDHVYDQATGEWRPASEISAEKAKYQQADWTSSICVLRLSATHRPAKPLRRAYAVGPYRGCAVEVHRQYVYVLRQTAPTDGPSCLAAN